MHWFVAAAGGRGGTLGGGGLHWFIRIVVLLVFLATACGRLGFDDQLDAAAEDIDAAPTRLRPEYVMTYATSSSSAQMLDVAIMPTRAGSLLAIATLSLNVGGLAERVTSVSDDVGSSYVTTNAVGRWTGTQGRIEIWYATNVAAGATTVTITSSGLTNRTAWVTEVKNVASTDAVESIGAVSDATAPVIAPAVAVADAPAFVLSATLVTGAVTSAASPFVNLDVVNGDGAAYAIVDVPGSYGAAWEAPGSDNYAAVTAAFRGAQR